MNNETLNNETLNNPKPRFPTILDNTIVTRFRSCQRSAFYEHFLGLGAGESIHLVAGLAIAAACETTRIAFYVEELDALNSISLGVETLIKTYGDIDIKLGANDPASKLYSKSFDRILDAFLTYFGLLPLKAKCTNTGVHQLGSDPYPPAKLGNSSGIEFSALLPLGLQNPQTGEELLYSIRFDALTKSPFGLMGLDEKTGSRLDANYSDQWQLRSQFLNYLKVAQLHDIPMKGIIARGLILHQTQFHFPEALIMPPQSVIDSCWKSTLYTINLMINSYRSHYFPGDFGKTCTDFFGCSFRKLCEANNPKAFYPDYERSYWHPETGTREVLSKPVLSDNTNPFT